MIMLNNNTNQRINAFKTTDFQRENRAFNANFDASQSQELSHARLNQRSSLQPDSNSIELKPTANFAFRGKQNHTSRAAALNSPKAASSQAEAFYLRVSRQAGKTEYRLSVGTPEQPVDRTQKVRKKAPKNGFAQQVFQLINVQRRNAGLQPLKNNPKLAAAAKNHSWDMATNDFISHTGSNNSTPFDRISATGYKYSLAAENVAAGQTTPEAVVNAWMNSPGHRANILNSDLREVGIGYYFLSEDTGNMNFQHYWTQDFGKPMA
jgi:uncharacterized protein YkwD